MPCAQRRQAAGPARPEGSSRSAHRTGHDRQSLQQPRDQSTLRCRPWSGTTGPTQMPVDFTTDWSSQPLVLSIELFCTKTGPVAMLIGYDLNFAAV